DAETPAQGLAREPGGGRRRRGAGGVPVRGGVRPPGDVPAGRRAHVPHGRRRGRAGVVRRPAADAHHGRGVRRHRLRRRAARPLGRVHRDAPGRPVERRAQQAARRRPVPRRAGPRPPVRRLRRDELAGADRAPALLRRELPERAPGLRVHGDPVVRGRVDALGLHREPRDRGQRGDGRRRPAVPDGRRVGLRVRRGAPAPAPQPQRLGGVRRRRRRRGGVRRLDRPLPPPRAAL
ncbi:MAG: hypothetical protein AVDCRST_MAG64-2059, partial [uncultured Phycisphaerae bacterium]